MIIDYVLKFHLQDCLNIIAEKDDLGYFIIKIDFLKLFETYPEIGDSVLCNPAESLPACNRDIINAQQNLINQDEYKNLVSKLDYCSLKRNVQARFFRLPVCPELYRTEVPKNVDLGCFLKVTAYCTPNQHPAQDQHVSNQSGPTHPCNGATVVWHVSYHFIHYNRCWNGNMLVLGAYHQLLRNYHVSGTAVRVTQSKMLEYQRNYVCLKCKYENIIEAKFENRYILKAPTKCANNTSRCQSTNFSQVNMVSREYCKDYQEIKIQEQVNKLSVGTLPGSMWVVLENDLVDSCKPGDDVNICGTVRRRWRPSALNKKSEVELVLEANSLEVCNTQSSEIIAAAPDVKDCFNEFWACYEACPLRGRDRILASVCPQVYGLHLVKLAVLLTVITGSDTIDIEEKASGDEDKHSDRVRGQCHLLLVGDPGTGKSQVLHAAAELSTRSVLTTGAGSTKAGLTCAALREEGVWQLEAGALVLSDGGVCCIDEIGQLREHDRTAIHEAMEQQTISVAKAGMVCKLNTRCAVVAACNPKGRYHPDEPLSVNVSLGTPLLSRFDLIFILLDKKNKTWDKLVSSYILHGGSLGTESKKQWSLEKLQMYIGLVGPRPTEMTEQANTILQSYYMMQRKSECRDASRTTVRMLDSLVRLSQAHCRLMYRTTILPMDVIVAISLVDLSMQDCTLSDTTDALHSSFHKYPDFEYLCTAKQLLSKLCLYEIWKQELMYYGKLLEIDHKTLGNEIDKGSTHYFTKFDDVSDDSIPLSSSIITSSYFSANNNKESKAKDDAVVNGKENKEINSEVNKVNKKIAENHKNHATFSKDGVKPPIMQKKSTVKRKLKEVIVDSSKVCNKTKKLKKVNVKPEDQGQDLETISGSGEENDTTKMLNAVPSVNDFFADLELDFNFNNSPDNVCMNDNKDEINFVSRHSTQKNNVTENKIEETNENVEILEKNHEESKALGSSPDNTSTSSRTIDKLKQYQYVGKLNHSKYDAHRPKTKSKTNLSEKTLPTHQTSISKQNNIAPLQNSKNSFSSVSSKSVQNLAISMFESSISVSRHSKQQNNLPDNNIEETNEKIDTLVKNHEEPKVLGSLQDHDTSSSRIRDKLKQYQYVAKLDLSKYEADRPQTKSKTNLTENNVVVPLKDSKNISNSSSVNSKSVRSSQISIFESSECDIDMLDIDLI